MPKLRTARAEAQITCDALELKSNRWSSHQLFIARMRYHMAERAYAAAVERVEQKVVSDPEVRRAFASAAEAWDSLRTAKAAELRVRSTWEARQQEIEIAISEKRLALGISEAQVEQVMGAARTIICDARGGKTLSWKSTAATDYRAREPATYARIVDGEVVDVWNCENHALAGPDRGITNVGWQHGITSRQDTGANGSGILPGGAPNLPVAAAAVLVFRNHYQVWQAGRAGDDFTTQVGSRRTPHLFSRTRLKFQPPHSLGIF